MGETNFYRLLNGERPAADAVLELLGVTRDQLERYRDAGFREDKGDQGALWVLCRTGGGNREYYRNMRLLNHPNYITDIDDPGDSTYAIYYFSEPGECYGSGI